jgi:heme exporter protein CcmD
VDHAHSDRNSAADDPNASISGIGSMMHVLVMGGYGRFVWSAYAVSAIALIAAVGLTIREYLRTIEQLNRAQSENKAPSA